MPQPADRAVESARSEGDTARLVKFMERSEVPISRLLAPETGRIYLVSSSLPAIIGTAIAAFITVEAAKAHLTQLGLFEYYVAITVGFGLAALWIASWETNLGVELGDGGVDVHTKSSRRGKVVRSFYPWETLGPPSPNLMIVYFWSGDDPFFLPYNQARALVRDPRYPLRGEVPPAARRRLGL